MLLNSPELLAWPGEPKPVLERFRGLAGGDAANVSRCHAGVRLSTHADMPFHLTEGAAAIKALGMLMVEIAVLV